MKCEGNCREEFRDGTVASDHSGEVRRVFVSALWERTRDAWFYCETARKTDRDNGFTVEETNIDEEAN